jgi:hypothetical protein
MRKLFFEIKLIFCNNISVKINELSFQSPVVTTCATCCNTKEPYIFLALPYLVGISQ